MEGKSSPSEVLVCTTNPDKPGPPSTPCVTAAMPYGFTVTWGKDTHPHTHARVLYTDTEMDRIHNTPTLSHSVIHKHLQDGSGNAHSHRKLY